jgi:hypothetical protein
MFEAQPAEAELGERLFALLPLPQIAAAVFRPALNWSESENLRR